MADWTDRIDDDLRAVIEAQHVFFVATATADSRINLSPKGMDTRPLSRSMPGMIVCIGRLPGAISFAWPFCRENPAPRFCSRMPNFSDAMPEPKPWKME